MKDETLNTYQRLSEEARKRNAARATQYNREKATKITVKYKNEEFEELRKYIEACGAKSNNSFFKEAVKYAVENDFKGVKSK